MKMTSLTIPDGTALWPKWIEDQLLSDDLADTVAELEVLARKQQPGPESLGDLLGDWLPEILRHGLDRLPADTVRGLLSRPVLLLELQERVLIEGGEYWEQRVATVAPVANDMWQGIAARLNSADPAAPAAASTRRASRRWWAVAGVLATAAVILIAVWVSRPQPAGWGFDKPGILAGATSEEKLLTTLADAAHAWFNKTPQDAGQLTTRLEQFDRGCQTLLSSELAPLSPETRDAVKEACRGTRLQIREHLANLRAGDDFEAIRQAANQTVEQLEKKIRRLQA